MQDEGQEFWVLTMPGDWKESELRAGSRKRIPNTGAPSSWSNGDLVFIWKPAPAYGVVGSAALLKTKSRGARSFELSFISDRRAKPLTREALARDPLFADAAFLKPRTRGTIFHLARDQGEALATALLERWRKPARRAQPEPKTKRRVARGADAAAPESRAAKSPLSSGAKATAEPKVALSVRQPWAELILRGIKTVEVRSVPTRKNERVFLYASLGSINPEAEKRVEKQRKLHIADLPRGLIVGSVQIVGCRPLTTKDSDGAGFDTRELLGDHFAWELAAPERLAKPWPPKNHPQPVFFKPR